MSKSVNLTGEVGCGKPQQVDEFIHSGRKTRFLKVASPALNQTAFASVDPAVFAILQGEGSE
jgi:hypothetical protein